METHVLVGAEYVLRAAHIMRDAAREFSQAVGNLEAEHRRHEETLRQLFYENRQDRGGA